MYGIRYDIPAHILHLKLEGFWNSATLAKFVAELLVRTTSLQIRGIDYAVLSDSTQFAIQSPLIAAGLSRIMDKGAKLHRGPTAIVVATHLNKIQAERTMKGDRLRIFLHESEARDWLATEMKRTPG